MKLRPAFSHLFPSHGFFHSTWDPVYIHLRSSSEHNEIHRKIFTKGCPTFRQCGHQSAAFPKICYASKAQRRASARNDPAVIQAVRMLYGSPGKSSSARRMLPGGLDSCIQTGEFAGHGRNMVRRSVTEFKLHRK